MAIAVIVAAFVGAAVLLYVLWHVLAQQFGLFRGKGVRYPPVQTGWIPWVGCALSFGREPLLSIQQSREKVHTYIFMTRQFVKLILIINFVTKIDNACKGIETLSSGRINGTWISL